jgi:hypothetical protein
MTLLPPPQYDVPPQIPVIERVLTWTDVQRACFDFVSRVNGVGEALAWRTNGGWNGCSAVSKQGVCYIWRIDSEATRRHEYGHCNGWGRDHAGGR